MGWRGRAACALEPFVPCCGKVPCVPCCGKVPWSGGCWLLAVEQLSHAAGRPLPIPSPSIMLIPRFVTAADLTVEETVDFAYRCSVGVEQQSLVYARVQSALEQLRQEQGQRHGGGAAAGSSTGEAEEEDLDTEAAFAEDMLQVQDGKGVVCRSGAVVQVAPPVGCWLCKCPQCFRTAVAACRSFPSSSSPKSPCACWG